MNKRIVSLALSMALVISAGVATYAVLAWTPQSPLQPPRLLGPFLKAKPSLGLVARNLDGTGLITFTLSDPAQPDLRGLDFQVDFNSKAPLLSFIDRFVGSTPPDTIREEAARSGKSKPSILYISPAMKAWEDEKSAAQNAPQPAPGVKPN